MSKALGEPDVRVKTTGSRRTLIYWLLGGTAALTTLPIGFIAFRAGDETRTAAPVQDHWRFCQKCESLFFDGYPAKGVCPAGGGHSAAGFMFILPHDVAGPGQADWRFCHKCHSMFFDGFSTKGVCPAGEGHSAAGFNFVLPHDVPGPGQAAWRFCQKCNAMFFDGYATKGVCPAGGAHSAAGFNFVLPYA